MNLSNRDFFVLDNLFVLRGISTESIDLIYLDPPFNTEQEQNSTIKPKDKQKIIAFFDYLKGNNIAIGIDLDWKKEYETPAFKDRWDSDQDRYRGTLFHKGTEIYNRQLHNYLAFIKDNFRPRVFNYLAFMAVRLVEMHRVLKSTGSLYLHCDQKMSHYLKLVLDFVFGEDNFRKEIIWNGGSVSGYKSQAKGWIRQCDTLLYYTKSPTYTFNKILLPYKDSYIKKMFKHKDEEGRAFRQRGEKRYYADEGGMPCGDNWTDIYSMQTITQSKEYVGYPTQKPVALLARIIQASTNEGDVVLDPFAGCATTCVAAEKLNRKWIGIDALDISYVLNVYRLVNEIWKTKAKATPIGTILPHLRRFEPVRDASDPEEDRKKADHIYLFANPAWEYLKVGISSDVDFRLRTFKTYTPYKDFENKYSQYVGIGIAQELEAKVISEFHSRYGGSKDENGEWIKAKRIEEVVSFIEEELKQVKV